MNYQDYYKILGVARDATQDEIKRAYRKLARKYHPDVSKEADAETRFKELGEAYEVLKDPEKRAAYDQLGHNWKAGQDFNPPPGWDSGFEFSGGGYTDAGAGGFSDFFESLFGGAANFRQGGFHQTYGPGARMRGEDHHSKIEISLEDAFHCATRNLRLQVPEYDSSGHLNLKQRTLQVKIPKGVTSGKRIRLSGQGSPGSQGAPAGDLFLEIDIQPHPLYQVDGKDIYLNLPITPWEAALGGKIKVPTLGGPVDMNIQAGARSGQKLRLKGRGLPGKTPGDQYAVLQIETPPADNAQRRQLYEQMAREMPFNPRRHLGG
ncbi:MAG: DnaJ C-terminal domain-containing protein [Chromatiales bacterium]|jgi:curved DNA-binding protein